MPPKSGTGSPARPSRAEAESRPAGYLAPSNAASTTAETGRSMYVSASDLHLIFPSFPTMKIAGHATPSARAAVVGPRRS